MPKEITFTITGLIPSKKNHHIIKINRKTRKPFIWPDEEYRLWEAQNAHELEWEIQNLWHFRWYKKLHADYLFRQKLNKDKSECQDVWDISNKLESINDMMVKAGMIDDDNQTILRDMSQRVIDCDIEENEVIVTLSEIVPTS
jgi:hypothetical protein